MGPRRCHGRLRAATVALLAVGTASLLCSGRAPILGQDGDLGVSLSPLVEEGRMTAKEPLLARITLSNRGDAPTSVVLGNSEASYLHLEVLDDRGTVLASTPTPGRSAIIDGLGPAAATIPPGEDRTRIWVVSGLYCFEDPGRYTIRLQVLSPRDGLPVRGEATVPLEVLPFDARRLDARCAELLEPCWKHSGFGELEMGCRTKALYSVRDDVALPYLDWMGGRYACRAIRRLGTERSQRLLQALQARTDSVGEAARKPPEIADFRMWDVECP